MDRVGDKQRVMAARFIIRMLLEKQQPVLIRDFQKYSSDSDLDLPTIRAIIDEYPNDLERFVDLEGEMVRLCTNLNLCDKHCSNESCIEICSGLHICKFYIMNSTCNFGGKCKFGHDLTTTHNRRVLGQHLLENANLSDVRFLLMKVNERADALIPKICKFYNVHTGCSKENCRNLHICKHYVSGECHFGKKCRRSHHIDSSIKTILQDHGIDTKRTPKEILADLRDMMCKEDSQSNRDGQLHLKDQPRFGGSSYCLGPQALKNISSMPGNIPAQNQGARPKTISANQDVQTQKMRTMSASVPNLQRIVSTEGDRDQLICLYNLCGSCLFKDRCINAHYNLPYQWLYRKSPERPWKDFKRAQQNSELEITYCDPSNASCYLEFSNGKIWDIDFKTMRAKGGKYEVKRLSTKSSLEEERHPLATKWKWYWKDQMRQWKLYGEDDSGYRSTITSEDIEQEYLARPGGQIVFATVGHEYILDFKKMVQQNVTHKTVREVVRRPELVDDQTFEEKKRLANQTRRTKHGAVQGSGLDVAPPTWSNVKGDLMDHFDVVKVNKRQATREYSQIEELFFESMPNTYTITSIERVENGDLWQAFLSKKKKMEKRASKEVKGIRLFHGTSSDYCQPICRQGFDFRLSGQSTGHLFGRGSYFANTARYSDAYAKSSERLIFVVLVLVGEYVQGQSKYVRPPRKDPTDPCSDLYDSCVDSVQSPKIYVIFDNSGQAYPEYVIKYTVGGQ